MLKNLKKISGKDYFVVATIMKVGKIFVILLNQLFIVSKFGELLEVKITNQKGIKIRLIYWKNLTKYTTDSYKVPMKIEISNQGLYDQLVMEDTFCI